MTHSVPADAVARTEATLAATPGLGGEPSDAERARTLLAVSTGATLSTIALDPAGFPFGSLVAIASDERGRPLLCLSDLAEHSRNLAADPRASIMVTEAGAGDPLAMGRASLVGEVRVLDGDEREAALERYRDAHPDAFWAGFSDFKAYRLEVSAVRYVGGFGRMSWVDPAGYTAAEPDPLPPVAARIIEHMNDDHADSLVEFCRHLADRPDTVEARMVGVDRYGFAVLAHDAPGGDAKAVRIAFPERADTADEVRRAMVAMVRGLRAA